MKKLALLLVVFLCGCTRAVEPNELAYVVAIGVDKSEKPHYYDVTLQIANPMAISGGSKEEGGEGGKKTISNISISSPNIFAAVNVANHLYSKNLSLAHTKLIVFCEELCREEGLVSFSETIARSEEIRPNTYMSVVKGKAKDYLEEIKPTNEVNPVQYYQVIFESDFSGFIPENPCQDFYAYELSPERENVLPLSAVKKEDEIGTEKIIYKGFEYLLQDYIAGEVEEESDTETQTYGMAIFRDGKMIAEAGAVETELYNIITGNYIKAEVTYSDKNDPQMPITLVQSQQRKPRIRVDIKGDRPKIKVNIYLEADLRTVSQNYIVEEELEGLEQQVIEQLSSAAKQFLHRTANEYQSDIIGFGSYAKRHFKSFDEFKAYDWANRYRDAEFEVQVDFHLRRSGLINRKRG